MRIRDWSSDVCSSDLVERREIEVLDPTEAGALLKTASTTRLHMPIFVTLATGLRRGEVLALRWSDIDLARNAGGTLTVAQSLEQTKDGLGSEEHTSERQSLMHKSYAVFCLKNKKREN